MIRKRRTMDLVGSSMQGLFCFSFFLSILLMVLVLVYMVGWIGRSGSLGIPASTGESGRCQNGWV